jgi:hypothetical protein
MPMTQSRSWIIAELDSPISLWWSSHDEEGVPIRESLRRMERTGVTFGDATSELLRQIDEVGLKTTLYFYHLFRKNSPSHLWDYQGSEKSLFEALEFAIRTLDVTERSVQSEFSSGARPDWAQDREPGTGEGHFPYFRPMSRRNAASPRSLSCQFPVTS